MRQSCFYVPALLSVILACSSFVNVLAQDQRLTVTWDPLAVQTQCQTATTASNASFAGLIDVLYFAGLSGAQSGTIGASVLASAGSYSFNWTWSSSVPQVNISACCLSPDIRGGAKFRCCCGGGNIVVQPPTFNIPFLSYPLCPTDQTLTLFSTNGTQFIYIYSDSAGQRQTCSGCDQEGVLTRWNPATNQCESIKRSGSTVFPSGTVTSPAATSTQVFPNNGTVTVPATVTSAVTSSTIFPNGTLTSAVTSSTVFPNGTVTSSASSGATSSAVASPSPVSAAAGAGSSPSATSPPASSTSPARSGSESRVGGLGWSSVLGFIGVAVYAL